MPHVRHWIALTLLLAGATRGHEAAGQCMLANPSFEVPGSAGTIFNGWSQFGPVASSTTVSHGAVAAKVSGPNTHVWDVSGVWQNIATHAGEKWTASVCVLNPSSRPLQGGSQALLNIEWRDAAGNLISYESHACATAATPTDRFQIYTVTSAAAPTGAVSTHFLLGVLQGPTDATPDVIFDQATFVSLGPPTHATLQWSDFPGGKTLSFSGRSWRVKGPGYYGPGPSWFTDSSNNTWVDTNGRLHLTVKNVSGTWYSTEVTCTDALGYGDYVFTTRGRLDQLDQRVVLGLFLWEYQACYDPSYGWWNPYNEIDVEFSRWNIPGNAIAQFVCQPYDGVGNIDRWDQAFSDSEVTSHAFRWFPNRVEYRSWRGGPSDESAATQTHVWTYTGQDLPRPEEPRVHLNLWQFAGAPSSTQEVIFDSFTFVPTCSSPPCGILAVEPPAAHDTDSFTLGQTVTGAGATLRYSAATPGIADVAVYTLNGRRLRALVHETVTAGPHDIVWNGCDESGRRAAAGVYVCQFRINDVVRAKRLVLVR